MAMLGRQAPAEHAALGATNADARRNDRTIGSAGSFGLSQSDPGRHANQPASVSTTASAVMKPARRLRLGPLGNDARSFRALRVWLEISLGSAPQAHASRLTPSMRDAIVTREGRGVEVGMLDHVTIGVGDMKWSKEFYDKALRPLGIERLYTEGETFAGYGANRKAFFWIGLRNQPQTGAHIAFTGKDRETVDAFYVAALAAGGRDNGQPGLRPHYHPNYYGAFILDRDGHNIEAVCHLPAA
jgi:catechol 2,3-dioxygenase-like lactoylglutathione lyase family enzyme